MSPARDASVLPLRMMALTCLVALVACTVLDPYKVAQTPEQKVGALLGDFDIYQQAALSIAKDETVAADIRLAVIHSARTAKEPMDRLSDVLKLYSAVKAQVLAGTSTEEKLATIATQMQGLSQQALPLLQDLKHWVGKVKR